MHPILKALLKTLAFTLLIFISSCHQRTRNRIDTFIVPILEKPLSDTLVDGVPLPPAIQTYYLTFNFIIDSSGQAFYYQRRSRNYICGTGMDWDTPPPFIDLQPKDIVQIPYAAIADFIKLNILSVDPSDRLVSIASINDTIKSNQLAEMLIVFKDTSNHIRWLFRKATQEESVVLKHKQKQAYYDSESIIWDSTKIGFMPTPEEMMIFTPPKVDK